MVFTLFRTPVVLLMLFSQAAAVLPLTVNGNRFYQLQPDWSESPESFPIIGANYQPGGTSKFSVYGSTDALSNAQICQRDAFLLKQLGVNAIHVSAVSPWVNHDQCMTILNNAGIYVMIDVSVPGSVLDPEDPAGSYNRPYLNNVFGLVDAFKNYPNLMGFIAANDVVNSTATAQTDPRYVKALVRDLKQYVDRWANRTIPVGYSAGGNPTWRHAMYEYLQCGISGNATEASLAQADFIGIDDFTWCSNGNWNTSDYEDVLNQFNGSSIPILMTGYGCDSPSPRTFDEVSEGLYGPLSEVLSGGFVYQYSDEDGLVTIDAEQNVSLKKDFDNFQTAVAAASFATNTLPESQAALTGTAAVTAAPTCDPSLLPKDATGFNWDVNLPPCPAADMILKNGGNLNVGEIANFPSEMLTFTWKLTAADGSTLSPTNTYASSYKINYQTNVPVTARKTVLAYGVTLTSSATSPAEPTSTEPTSTSETEESSGPEATTTSASSSTSGAAISGLQMEGAKNNNASANAMSLFSLFLAFASTASMMLFLI